MASRNNKPVIRGKALAYNAGHAARYHAKLAGLVKQMRKATEKAIRNLFDTDHAQAHFGQDASVASQARIVLNGLDRRFSDLFGSVAKTIAPDMVNQANKLSGKAVEGSLKELSGGSTIKLSAMNPAMQNVMKAAVAENVQLIKSIAKDYLHQVGQQVMRSIVSGQGLSDLLPAIQERGNVTESRAKLIAYDQTRKVYSSLNSLRVKNAGVKKFEWIHSGGGQRPRELHLKYDGQIFDFSNPPIIDENTGERGMPGQAINCRCTLRPIVDFESD